MNNDDDGWARRRSRYQPYHASVIEQSPDTSLDLIIKLVQAATDSASLCAIGVILIDPLLDIHWQEIADRFAVEMRGSDKLRKAFSCTMLDIPEDIYTRLHDLVDADDDIGHGRR